MFRIKKIRPILALLATVSLLAAACDAPPATELVSPLAPAPSGRTPADLSGLPADQAEMIGLVTQDLAERLSVPAGDIEVATVTAVDWPDASLGCPVEGQVYAQVVTSGLRISLVSGEQTYTYHTGPGSFVLCPQDEEGLTAQADRTPGEREDLEPEVAALVDRAIEDLAKTLGISADRIALESVESVQWRDSSLGCPIPGQSYLTVITPGYRIRLTTDGEVYEYHTDRNSQVVTCEEKESSDQAGTGDEAAMAAIKRVRADLAARLGVEPSDIGVASVTPETWPTSALGCPQPGRSYAQVVTPGYAIVLVAGDGTYVYHASEDAFVMCESDAGEVKLAEPPAEEPILDPTLARLVELARRDLSAQKGIPYERITLQSAREVDWRDSSLGCPEAGSAYLTVITPGYLILLDADGETYQYHADQKRVVTCDNPQAPLEP